MDFEWALKEARRFQTLVTQCNVAARNKPSTYIVNGHYQHLAGELSAQQMIAEKIAQRLNEPDLADHVAGRGGSGVSFAKQHLVEPAARLILLLQRGEEIEEKLGPVGPSLNVTQMHRWVWEAAAGLWDSRHRRAAVQQAATALFDGYLPAKLDVPKTSQAADPTNAFSTKPASPSSPRLRSPAFAEAPEDAKNVNGGARFLGMACQMLARNLSTHNADDIPEQVALEQLAMLSQFARLVDTSVRVTSTVPET